MWKVVLWEATGRASQTSDGRVEKIGPVKEDKVKDFSEVLIWRFFFYRTTLVCLPHNSEEIKNRLVMSFDDCASFKTNNN